MGNMEGLVTFGIFQDKMYKFGKLGYFDANFSKRYLGDLKESPSLGESSHVMFSRMAKYSSLTAFYTFSEQHSKAIEDKVCLHQS